MNMKINRMTLIAAAAAAMMTSTLHADSPSAKLEIPFAFHASSKALPAGTYRAAVENHHGSKFFAIRQGKTGAIFAVHQTGSAPDDGKVTLTFTCATTGCDLFSARFGEAQYQMPIRKLTAAEKERMYTVTIPATSIKAAD
jgi:hypothetical protein